MDAVRNMNGTIWVFAAVLISLVLVQSFLFLKLALNFNKKNKLLRQDELKSAVQTGAIAAIGPSISSIVVALSLIAMVGGACTFMRCGVIGAPGWELLMANIGVSAAGVKFGTPEFTEAIFTMCIFCMVLGSAPYFLNTIIMLKPLDTLVEKSKAKKAKISFMPYVGTSAMFGLLGYMFCDYFKSFSSVAAIGGAVIGYILFDKVAQKSGKPILGSFSLAVGMICGMVVGQAVAMLAV
ncbi:MAG: DUF5058 family protein [Clostridiaceae bacterium]|nr:DUF5058 family protein [Clostridiaceae bacterium]